MGSWGRTRLIQSKRPDRVAENYSPQPCILRCIKGDNKMPSNRSPHRFPLPATPPSPPDQPKTAAPTNLFAPSAALSAIQQSTPEPPTIEIPIESGATAIPDRTVFEQLARRDDVPGALDVLEVKFLMTGVDTEHPVIYFLNTNNIQ